MFNCEDVHELLRFRRKINNGDIYLFRANLNCADLSVTNLQNADLSHADLCYTYLDANLMHADLRYAKLRLADIRGANLYGANLHGATGLVKKMGVENGNIYWKRFENGLTNKGYKFKVGLNKLRKNEIFADDPRVLRSYPGFHFASRSWCAENYPKRLLEAKIRIPKKAKINEPWAADGTASADMIEILQVFVVATREDVTEKYRG